jgi:hypothetical protein
VSDVSSCLESFRTCGQLQYLLAFVRDVANTMNASAVAGPAVEGLKLESLNRLQVCAVCLDVTDMVVCIPNLGETAEPVRSRVPGGVL